ncbi:MAG: MBL fold metallo-hydrolase [Rubrimonas sp.]
MPALPVAETWFVARRLDAATTLILEPRVHPLEQANIFLVEGRDRDMVVDTGMGVAPLRPFLDTLRADPTKPVVNVSTHTHIDHVGGAWEFDERLVHPAEADDLERPRGMRTLRSADFDPAMRQLFLDMGYPPLWEWLIDALPHADFDPAAWRLRGVAPTALIDEGDVIDLGDSVWTVLHLPGHSPGQIGLYDAASGVLFGADAIYDGPLVFYPGDAQAMADYAVTLRRLRDMPVSIVHGGHDPSFGPERMRAICDDYLARFAAL